VLRAVVHRDRSLTALLVAGNSSPKLSQLYASHTRKEDPQLGRALDDEQRLDRRLGRQLERSEAESLLLLPERCGKW
jgi:hypothetical protein